MLSFRGGIHPPEKKELAKESKLIYIDPPEIVYVFLSNHAGAPAKCLVKENDSVKTGQVIGEPGGFISAYLHSPVTGVVKKIDKIYHPIQGRPMETVVIERTSQDEWQYLEHPDWENLSKEQLLEVVKKAGIVGLGGAMFPTHVKLNPPANKKIDTFIVNAAECEPYLTVDYRLMLERYHDLILGIKIVMKILQVQKAYIGIESNKTDVFNQLKSALDSEEIELKLLKTKYPQGAEKQLIYAITGRKVPVGGLPMDVGVVVQNVQTVIAIKEAVVDRKPLIQRAITISGEGVNKPVNLIARIGTKIEELLQYAGGLKEETERVILGGPMTGISVNRVDIPIMKGTSGITALLKEKEYTQKACIRCTKCVIACPMDLQPYLLYLLANKRKYDEAVEEGLLSCIECGSCAYVCPSKIDHVRAIKLAKKVYQALRGGKK
ncbi:electron transport complex subunit RsxC [Pseudothermotoga sp. U03pept]|uniref:electron transport complex subunit RsxC n=1 Tax=Pseudothermotoga sp. U03pept TaxID=3447012 RepID=UPI003F06BA71